MASPMSSFPTVISSVIQMAVSLKRINKFMNSEELDSNAVSHDPTEKDVIVVEQGHFSWEAKDENSVPTLQNINMRISPASFVAICGTVGSGKSSILSALLGEMFRKSGRVNTNGSLAYVAQQAWILNDSVRDNILFGKSFDQRKYDQVLDACALRPDLQILAAGDRTEIGEKGINLSGGQKQRISLARAVYNDADVYLLDDPLSAVDSHVGKHIFEQVLGPAGLLKNKTRVLVTHAVTYLPQVDKIFVVRNGEISETGSYLELLKIKGAFADFLAQHIGSNSDTDVGPDSPIVHDLEDAAGINIEKPKTRSSMLPSRSLSDSYSSRFMGSPRQVSFTWESDNEDTDTSGLLRKRRKSRSSVSVSFEHRERKPSSVQIPNSGLDEERLIQDETLQTGNVKWAVFLHYFRAIGFGMTLLTFLAFTAYEGFTVGSNFWLSFWANANTVTVVNPPSQTMYLAVYTMLGIGQGVGILTATVVLARSSLRASNTLHKGMLYRILLAPMSFFDTTPLGRIVNRFSKDVNVCDSNLRSNFEMYLNSLLRVVSVLCVISFSTPLFTAIIVPVAIIYMLFQRFYIATSRQLRRLESVTKSPIFSHFSETLSGCSTIRAYAAQERFISKTEATVDTNQGCFYMSYMAKRWLAMRLQSLGNLIVFFAALFAVIKKDTLTPALVGLSITYALEATGVLNWLVRMSAALETDVISVERIKEYSEIPQEASWETNNKVLSKQWPENGEITFENYGTRYREGLDLVLRGISCKILAGEKVGVVGRTGAGKSSLTLALFRIIEPEFGRILVDGENIENLGLHDLRSQLTIIPQDPVLFSGSLRINLDPLNQYSDEVIWRALELAHLKDFVKGLASGLEHEVAENGENLSVGQRQLICLARALLRKKKILILDEATAALDLETDELIQQTIRTEFSDCTVVTIAHRLNTIMDSTRVIVLENGEIREFDSPEKLLGIECSIFHGMAKDAGLI